MSDRLFPRLPAVLRNAATWAAAWAAAGGALVAVLSALSPPPERASLLARLGMAVVTGIAWGVRFGIAGAVIGTVFALAVRRGYRGRRLADIDPLRFALLGAVVGGAGVPLFLQLMNVLSGDGSVAWGLVADDGVWAAVFGAAAAAGSILLARRADGRSTGRPPGARAAPGGRGGDRSGLTAAAPDVRRVRPGAPARAPTRPRGTG